MSKLREYFLCARPHSFPATFAPIFLGASFSLRYVANFNWLNFILFLIASIFIQAATNFFNEYYDYKRGLDKIDSQGISGSIVKGNLTANEVMRAAFMLYLCALAIGIYLSSVTSYKLFLVGLVSMLVGYLYTGGKYPIAYSPFGEIFAGFFMGSLISVISFYLQTKYINVAIFFVSIPLFILVGAILLANNIRDLDNDKEHGRKTYAILVGRENAIATLKYMFISSYIFSLVTICFSFGNIYIILCLITIPLANKIIKGFKFNKMKETMAPYMVLTAKLTIFTGFLLSLSYLLSYYL